MNNRKTTKTSKSLNENVILNRGTVVRKITSIIYNIGNSITRSEDFSKEYKS